MNKEQVPVVATSAIFQFPGMSETESRNDINPTQLSANSKEEDKRDLQINVIQALKIAAWVPCGSLVE